MNRLPTLAYEMTLTGSMLLRSGFILRPRRAGSSWRAGREYKRGRQVRTSASIGPAGQVPSRMIELYDKYEEVWAYLDKSPWAPDHMVERFRALTLRADVLLSAYHIEDMVKTEQDRVHLQASEASIGLVADLESLLAELLNEADRSQSGTYGALQAKFRSVALEANAEDSAYRELSSTYHSFMAEELS